MSVDGDKQQDIFVVQSGSTGTRTASAERRQKRLPVEWFGLNAHVQSIVSTAATNSKLKAHALITDNCLRTTPEGDPPKANTTKEKHQNNTSTSRPVKQ